jgi:signal transduction histidine kinase
MAGLNSKTRNFPLQFVLVVPFVLQVFGAVGLVGYLSFRYGQHAVNDLADQLMIETSQRVDQHLDSYLATPHKVLETDYLLIQQRLIDPQDFSGISRLFWQQVTSFNFSFINYGTTDGNYAGSGRNSDDPKEPIVLGEKSPITNNFYINHTTDTRGRVLDTVPDPSYDYQTEAWYTNALKADRPIWSPVYIWSGQYSFMSIAATRPIFNQQNQPVGAIGIDILLSNISEFLRKLKAKNAGQVFIIEQDGKVIGSSSIEQPFVEVNGEKQRLNVRNSKNLLVQTTAKTLLKRAGDFKQITQPQQFSFVFQGQQQYVHVMPWTEQHGLSWLVVVVMPESAFMAQINDNMRNTLWLCLGALTIATVLSLYTSRWIIQPILQLQGAIAAFAAGNLEQKAKNSSIRELNELASSFNNMSEQLQVSFIALENANNQLEIRVGQRTNELSETLSQLQQTQAKIVQSEKMSALGQMVAGVAHEINNPAGFIHGNLGYVNQYMQDLLRLINLYQQHYPHPHADIEAEQEAIDLAFLQEDLAKLLRSMQVGTERIREIILSLRNFSRLDESDFKTVNIHEGIDSTLLLLHHRLNADHLQIQVIRDYAELPLVECYPGQLNQVFMNLLSNAIDALEELGTRDVENQIWISTELIEDNVRICVADNGVGMQDDVRSNVFNPFFTTKPVGKGTGLGLSISYQIVVEKHQGQVWCDSVAGEGTKFLVEIPVQQNPSLLRNPQEQQ